MAAQQQQQLLTQPVPHPILGVHAHSPVKMAAAAAVAVKSVKSAPPPPPPRTTPVSTAGGSMQQQQQQPQAQQQAQAASAAAMRPVPNPVLQRPGGAQQFHESPDEGYHEDDNGSEAL